jgi:HEAT repeat protein
MALTMNQLRTLLDPDEPNYTQIRALLQPDDVPNLEALATGPDLMLASKAAYALSLIGTLPARDALARLAAAGPLQVRIAVASGLPNLRGLDVSALVTHLLADPDFNVRKGAIKASRALKLTALAPRLQTIAASDQVPALRQLAADALDELR